VRHQQPKNIEVRGKEESALQTYRINSIRWPDEFRYALNSVAENFDKHAEASDDLRTITLNGLSPEQVLAHDVFMLGVQADEVLTNLNMVMGDIERLSVDANAFLDRNPFDRFQLLLRLYFYEYGRFEDVFGYFTNWMQQCSLLTKAERKAEREAFYGTFEYAIKTRNTMLHAATDWRDHCSAEIAILQGLEAIGRTAVDASGNALTWNDHIGPLCTETLPALLAMGQHMQVFWNMQMAHLALALVGAGKLQKEDKPYVGPHAAEFLKANANYR
jgi:hypothetical protein